jgi:hypothetical protein
VRAGGRLAYLLARLGFRYLRVEGARSDVLTVLGDEQRSVTS